MAEPTPRGDVPKWLDRHLESPPADRCILWPYATQADGYGQIRIDGQLVYVTHVVLERTGRPRPPAPRDLALHSCDNPPCVNPAHLRWGSNAENAADKVRRERAPADLTPAAVREIRDRYAAGGITQQALADRYGVTQQAISYVVNRKRWTHV